MAETVARRGGLVVIPQDIPLEVVTEVVSWVKARHLVYETPITVDPADTVGDLLNLLPKRVHGAAVVLEGQRPVGVVTEADCQAVDRFTQVGQVMSRELLTVPDGIAPEEAFKRLSKGHHRLAPVVDEDGALAGLLTRESALRATLYTPAVDDRGRLRIAAAIGVNGDVAGRAKTLLELGVDALVVGHRARPPGEDALRAPGGARSRPAGARRGGQRRLGRGASSRTWWRPACKDIIKQARSGSPARCAPLG